MKTVLVTGATGFVASHLIPILSQQGWKIRAAIRSHQEVLQKRYPAFTSLSLAPISIGEIDGSTDWGNALQKIDVVVHLAARAHLLQDSAANSEAEFLKVNSQGTVNLVRQSIQAGVRHFVFVSSIGAMATLSHQPLTENSPCQPDTAYGRSKLQAEQALIKLANQSKITWTIFRPTLVYGPGNPGNMERLIKLVSWGLPLPFGLVKNRRSFIYVANLADAIAISLTHPQARNQIFLVSDGQDLSTPQLIRQIARHLERPCYLLPVPPSFLKLVGYWGDTMQQLVQRPMPFNTPMVDRLLGSLVVDNCYIQSALKWQPPYTIDQGLQQTLQPRCYS